ncbi:MAG: cyclase family protein [Lachnospiraceae bacterium]|nr:cyclase family protein [Lachnospiraceae bacterium]
MFIDITKNINTKTKIFEGDPIYSVSKVSEIKNGDEFNLSKIEMGSHFATHIDSPKHFFDEGADVSQLDINLICGKCVVVSVNQAIDENFLKSLQLEPKSRILFKSEGKFGITDDGAKYIATLETRIVGTDAMDIEDSCNEGFCCHKILLGNGIPIIEGLELFNVRDGEYRLICLPLKMDGLDGVSLRVVLEECSI